jgi:2'-5' RNA ligase
MNTSVMVDLLPDDTSWCKIEPAHMTLVWCGEIDNLKKTTFNDLSKDAAALAMISNPILVKVFGVKVFGGGSDPEVDALVLESTPELLAMRRFMEDWDVSEFPFTPHATIGPVGSGSSFGFDRPMPMLLRFDRITVGWGDEYLTFWLKKF